MTKKLLAAAAVIALGLVTRTSRAEDERATFAIVIGSNASVDANLAPLHYADDDAARYLDLFRLLGARTYLLTRLDENTRRLHPQAAAEATDPTKASYESALAQLAADVTKASQRGLETTVYFVYAGHGNVQNGLGYITLEDLRITGPDLAGAFAKVPATRIHVIVDACASYFLAYSRGPGGERRPIEGIGLRPALAGDARIGLLLSTSSARESHEWDAFQSGVFSHEVRSGLYGAADADNDGQVSYREIAAFVQRANAAIPNDRFRPNLHARAPESGGLLVDLRKARGRRVEIDGKHAGRWYFEDARGVRIADVHNAEGQSVSLLRPSPSGRTYLHRVEDDTELLVEGAPDAVTVADLTPAVARVAARGGAHESFGSLFALPFDAQVVAAYEGVEEGPPPSASPPRRPTWRTVTGIAALGTGAAALGTAIALTVTSLDQRADGGRTQVEIADVNESVKAKQTAAGVLYAVSGVAVAGGLAALLWPTSRPAAGVRGAVVPGGAFFGYGASF